MNLATMRTRVRNAIKDLDSNAYYFTDNEIDAQITRALNDYCQQAGQVGTTTLNGTGSAVNFTINVGSVTDYLYTLAVEYPIDLVPPTLLRFQERPPTNLRLLTTPPASGTGNIRVWYAKLILAADATWAMPVTEEHIIATGACYYLALAGARFAATRLNSSQHVPAHLAALAEHWSDDYRHELRRVADRTEYPTRFPSWPDA